MSPTELVTGVFLFLIGFLVGRCVLERGPASQVEQRPERRSMPPALTADAGRLRAAARLSGSAN